MKAYKRQIEEAEEIAAINLAKFRKAADDVGNDRAERAVSVLAQRAASVARAPSVIRK